MPKPQPSDNQRRYLTAALFRGRTPGDPTERRPDKPRPGSSRVRHAIEDDAERRRLKAETDWLD